MNKREFEEVFTRWWVRKMKKAGVPLEMRGTEDWSKRESVALDAARWGYLRGRREWR